MVDVAAVVCELATKSHDVTQTQGSNDTADGHTAAQRQSTGRRGIISVSVSVSVLVLVSIKSFYFTYNFTYKKSEDFIYSYSFTSLFTCTFT